MSTKLILSKVKLKESPNEIKKIEFSIMKNDRIYPYYIGFTTIQKEAYPLNVAHIADRKGKIRCPFCAEKHTGVTCRYFRERKKSLLNALLDHKDIRLKNLFNK